MKKLLLFMFLVSLMTVSYGFNVINEAQITLTSVDVYTMLEIVEDRYDFEATGLRVFYLDNELIYEFKGYKTITEGYTTRQTPYTLLLDKDLNPAIYEKPEKEDNIGISSIFLGIPGILVYLFYSMVGIL